MWYLYILRCVDDTLYVGETGDLRSRVARHNDGRGSTYTAKRCPVRVVYSEQLADRATARQRERQLKGWTQAKKEALTAGDFVRLKQL